MRILDLLFPPKCILCGRILEKGEQILCDGCYFETDSFQNTKIKLPFIDGWTSLWYYEGTVRESLLRYKFNGQRSYAEAYGSLLGAKISQEHPEPFDLVTWVPISSLRKFRRGYDQSALLARAVAKELGVSDQRLLKKIRNNKPQSGISGAAHRRANVLGVYRLEKADVRGKRILLLDDIITTGATAGECARMLLTAGAKEVYCGAVACARHDTKQSR